MIIPPANPTMRNKKAAIPKIDRAIAELEKIELEDIADRSQIEIYAKRIESLLGKVFGYNTSEYKNYINIANLDTAPIPMDGSVRIEVIRRHFSGRISNAIATLKLIREDFINDIADAEAIPTTIVEAYQGLSLHPAISAVTDKLYLGGHYAEAVQAASKRLVNLVKDKSGIKDRDGKKLMEQVFNKKNPILKVNSLSNQSEEDEQEGFMYLFIGAVMGIRNPRAHESIDDTAEGAIELIAFLSLLAKKLDEAYTAP